MEKKTSRSYPFTLHFEVVNGQWTDNGWKDRMDVMFSPQYAGKKRIRYLVAGLEVAPTTGRYHWQGYVELLEPMRFAGIKKLFGNQKIHIEEQRGTRFHNRTYCKKDGKFFEWGEWIGGETEDDDGSQGTRTDLDELKKSIKEGKNTLNCFEDHKTMWRCHNAAGKYRLLLDMKKQREVGYTPKTIEVYVGPTGCGKTKKAFEENRDAYFLDNSITGAWWDGYDGEETVIIDEFRGWVPYPTLLRWTDGYPVSVPYKGGTCALKAKKIVITSNIPPEEWYPAVNEKDGIKPLLRRISKVEYFKNVEVLENSDVTTSRGGGVILAPPPENAFGDLAGLRPV